MNNYESALRGLSKTTVIHRHSLLATCPRRMWQWLLTVLLSVTVTNVYADRLTDSDNFKVTEHGDHVTFEIMIADLYASNTWCEWGSIRAYTNSDRTGTVYHLMDVETDDNGDDDKEGWDFYAQPVLEGGKAWLTNPKNGDEKEIVKDSNWGDRDKRTKYTMDKGTNDNYLTVKIDYYYPPQMKDKKWYFYYEYKHNGGSSYNMSMGNATCHVTYQDLNYTEFQIERTGANRVKFITPALPDETTIPERLRTNRWYEGWYELDFRYTLQDGTTKRSLHELKCEKSQKTHTLELPADIGNFKSVNVEVNPHWRVKCEAGGQFQGGSRVIWKTNLFETVPVPHGLSAEYNQYDNKAALVWNAFPTGDNNYIKNSIPYVYRVKTDKNGTPQAGEDWSKRGTLESIGDTQEEGYTDNMLESNQYYKYMVVNVPKAWLDNGSIKADDMNKPTDKVLNQLGWCESNVVQTLPHVSIYNLSHDVTVKDKVRLTWAYSRVPVSAANVKFEIMRRKKGTSEWTQYGNVSAPSNPSDGYVASFTDTKLPSVVETFDYKVVLAINSGNNVFESDVVTAGLLTGSEVTSIEATKGTHESVVRVSWNVRQVGTDPSNFELFRRYAGTNDEYLKIYSTSGVSDSYTYEDNTVQSGYFYEYRVDVYAGEKTTYSDNNFQNCLSDVGFCQARGVISGRVTFGSGLAVPDVRLSLRSNSDGDGNAVRGYSQRVSDQSTGIEWAADSLDIIKLFGKDKDYNIQFFVRPDDNLQHGVLCELPGFGRLRLGAKESEGYHLYLEKYGDKTIERLLFPTVMNIRSLVYNSTFTSGEHEEHPDYGTVFTRKEYVDISTAWAADGYKCYLGELGNNYFVSFAEKELPLEIYAHIDKESWQGSWYDTGLILPPNTYTLVSFQRADGKMTVTADKKKCVEFPQVTTKFYSNEVNEADDLENTFLYEKQLLYSKEGNYSAWGFDYVFNNFYVKGTAWAPDGRSNVKYSMRTQPIVNTFSVGGSKGLDADEVFQGNVTEVRVWDHALTEKEEKSVYDRVLSGREKGLALYWPMDEGISRFVFDASYANDVPNSRHATVGNNISSSTIVPVESQLSRYGLTNEQGEYSIRSIPYVGTGTTYTVTPTKDIHVFQPTSRNGFIGNGSLALNSYDFSDESAFPVRGKVTYLNTNIPSDSIQFKVDGDILQSKDRMIISDANGEYEITVPIGEHIIECYRDGHRLTGFPLDGTKYDFREAMTVNFVDSTLVNVTGRVNGGFVDQDEPVGFARSKNRLGRATLKLSLGKESQCSFNYIVDSHGDGKFGTENIPVESATEKIKSTGYRAGGEKQEDTHYIYVTTDPETGEFSALLPPLKYKVESITFPGGDDYNSVPAFSQNLPVIDATITSEKAMPKDTLRLETKELLEYPYSAKAVFHYRAAPTISVQQTGMKPGVFGELKVDVENATKVNDSGVAEKEQIDVVKFDGDKYSYVFGHPVFKQGGTYEYSIYISEQYKNLDTNEEFSEIPADALVIIKNDASALTTVIAENANVNGTDVKIGEAIETPDINVKPDGDGHVSYLFEGGWPNLADGNLRNMSIGVRIDGRTTMWKAPDSKGDALDLVLVGSISSGTNFVTYGPDDVDMILRRPPGSTSEASLESKTIKSTTIKTEFTRDGGSFVGGVHLQPTPTFTFNSGKCLGITVLNESKYKIVIESEHTGEAKWWDTEDVDDELTYSCTQEIHGTTDGIQYHGDTYIGRSTNLLFGKGFNLGIYKQPDGKYKLQQEEGITVSESFGTYFAFPQEYIEETLIPNWEAIIKARLTEHVCTGDHWVEANSPRVKGEVRYYTKYKPGDPEFGLSNTDSHWTQEQKAATGGCPSYRMVNGTDDHPEDEVERAILQIAQWKNIIALNEQDKLEAFADKKSFIKNYSIAGGTSIEETTTEENKTTTTIMSHHERTYNTENKGGFMLNDAGAYAILGGTRFSGENEGSATGTGRETSVSWKLSDGDPRTALSVDVYRSKRNWGPIFRTRGGQTVNPYEGETFTKYYMGGGAKLDEATMRVEKPQLRCDGSTQLSNIPSGTEAKFELQMKNLSETNSACTYILEAIESSNAKGAILKIDGAVLSLGKTGRAIPMQGGETISKMLYVSQSDRSINRFEELKLVLRSEKDGDTHSDTLKLSVEYVPASASVEMAVDHTVLNKADHDLYKGVKVTFSNLDRQDEGLRGVRLQYRRKGTDSWTQAHQWRLQAYMQAGDEELPTEGDAFSCMVEFTEDGQYELRGQTFGMYGRQEVTYETPIVEMLQDTNGPKVLGMPSPQSNLLTYTDRNEMHIRFNEELNVNALSETDNFRIEGDLNNTSTTNQYTDVAVQLNGNEVSTEASYTLNNSDFAFGMWFYRQGDGNIISLGTTSNKLSLFTHDGGKLAARVGDTHSIYDTETVLPENIWTYIAFNYRKKTTDDPQNRITMLYVNSKTTSGPVYVGDNVPAGDLEGQGKLTIGGQGMTGMMHALSLWNINKSVNELYEARNDHFAPYTPGLVGFWEMKEGRGTTLTDNARSRHMIMPGESWYINNRNLAAHLDGTAPMKVNIATFNTRLTDSYAMELWFRGEKGIEGNKNAQLLSVLNGISIGFKEGKLTLERSERSVNNDNTETKTVAESFTISEKDYNDNAWHHLALNVRRGMSAIVYVDGDALKTIPETSMTEMRGSFLMVGGEQTLVAPDGSGTGGVTNLFTGDVDEVRLWNASLDGQLILERRYERLNNEYAGLVGYFPMESIHRNEQGTIITEFSTDNYGNKDSQVKNLSTMAESVTAPALLPGASRIRLEGKDFDFTASKDEIYFTFPDHMLPLMDGNVYTISVSNIKDKHGNPSEPIEWQFRCDFAALTFLGSPSVEKQVGETKAVTTVLYNLTYTTPQDYEITGMPSWMTVDNAIGTTEKTLTDITFTILPSVPVGRYVEYIYVTDSRGLKRVLPISVKVKGDEPEWSVDPNRYESNMMVTGQLILDGKISQFSDSKIAAFDDLGICRGVASPVYVDTRDAYYVDMVLYGAAATELSTGERDLTFKMYDASTGIIYPVVSVTMPDGTTGTTLRYSPDGNIGSYDKPVLFSSTDNLVETVNLPRGWTWMSVYVQPASTAIGDILPKSKTELKKYQNIKSKTAIASVKSDGSAVIGELKEIAPGNMYKIQTSTATKLDVYGTAIDVTKSEYTIYPGFNWIGTLSNSIMSVGDAFADLNPQKDDMVKTRTAMATYNGKGVWEGTLKNITPGEGYIYLSQDTKAKTFNYPRQSNGSVAGARAEEEAVSAQALKAPSTYEPVDEHLYPDNMNVIAVIEKNGERREDAEMGAFVNGECRGAVTCNSGYYFLTILGSSNDDRDSKVELRVMLDGEEYVVGQMDFISDAVYGTLDEPKVFDVDATGIGRILMDEEDDAEWYTVQGIKLGRKPTAAGVYIHRGQKVIIKAKKH